MAAQICWYCNQEASAFDHFCPVLEPQIGEHTVLSDAPWGTAAETFGEWYDADYAAQIAASQPMTRRRITARDAIELAIVLAVSAALAWWI